jgi:hypothetical protein
MESIHHLAKCHAALLQPTPRLTQNLGNFLGVLSRGLANKHSHSGLTRHKISDHKPCERSNEGKAWMAKTRNVDRRLGRHSLHRLLICCGFSNMSSSREGLTQCSDEPPNSVECPPSRSQLFRVRALTADRRYHRARRCGKQTAR